MAEKLQTKAASAGRQGMVLIMAVAGLTAIAKILGFVRVMLLASVYGTGIEASAFEAAYKIPDLVFSSAGMALATTFIPLFTEYRQLRGEKEAFHFANITVNALVLVTAAVALLGIAAAPWLVRLIYIGFEGEIYYLTVELLQILFPVVILIAATYTFVGILQCLGEFRVPAIISLPSNLINIAYLACLNTWGGIRGFAAAVLAGWTSQVLVQIKSLRSRGYRYRPVLDFRHEGLKRMLIMAIPIILGTSVQQINGVVNGALASTISNSAVAALSYANYLYITIAGIFTYAITAVVFPSLARDHSALEYGSYRESLRSALLLCTFILAPLMAGILALSQPFIQLLLERGRFDAASTSMTAEVLFFYALGIVAFGFQEIFNKAFYALHDTRAPMRIAVVGMGANIALSITLVRFWGLGGVALACALSTWLIALLLYIRLDQRQAGMLDRETFRGLVKILGAAGIMGTGLYFLAAALETALAAALASGALPYSGPGIPLLLFTFEVGAGVLVYYILAWSFRLREAQMVLQLIKSLWARLRGEETTN